MIVQRAHITDLCFATTDDPRQGARQRAAFRTALFTRPRISGLTDVDVRRLMGVPKGVTQDTLMLYKQQRRILSVYRITRLLQKPRSAASASRSNKQLSPPATDLTTRDLYQFGVYTGGGLKAWIDSTLTYNVSFSGHVWGFDSFEGMPDEENASSVRTPRHMQDPAWQPGGLNARVFMKQPDWPSLQATLRRNIGHPDEKLHFIRGFFNETLTEDLATRSGMRPAFLVDIDCDLYSSTMQALDFMLTMRLLVPGSFVYYDDISDRYLQGAIHRQNGFKKPVEEALAHLDITAKWGLKWKSLPTVGLYPGPLGGRLSWIAQFPNTSKGNWIPPEYYPPVVQLISCSKCG
jgi:hypothetical protein